MTVKVFRASLVAPIVALFVVGAAQSPSAASVTSVTCIPAAEVRHSATYGVLANYGAQCAHSLDVTVKAVLRMDGKKVDSGQTTCKDTDQNEWCESFLFKANPKGKQRFKVVVRALYKLAGSSATPIEVRTVTSVTM